MRTIAIVNQKGGCGKTTTAIHLAAVFAKRGKRTLLVDLDPQSHCAAGLGVPESQIEFSIGEAMTTPDHQPIATTGLLWEVARNLDLAPSTTRLAALEAPGGGLHALADRDRRLASVLSRLTGRYDIVLIDCPPTIGLLTFNALRAAREAIVPVETGYFSLRGAEKQWKTIQRMIDRLNRPIICHMLPTLYDPSSRIARELLQQLRQQFPHQVTDVQIHEHESLREAASFGQPIIEYAPNSPAHNDFEELADWLESHAGGQGQVRIDINRPNLVAARTAHQPFNLSPNGEGAVARSHAHGDEPALQTDSRLNSGRAAELVQRVRSLQLADAQTQTDRAEDASHARNRPINAATTVVAPRTDRSSVRFGVNQTVRGVVFCQPHAIGRELFVTGDFNGWSPTRDRMFYDERTKAWLTTINIPPGRYLYRIIIDGQTQTDAYNDEVETSIDNQSCSVLTVEAPQSSP